MVIKSHCMINRQFQNSGRRLKRVPRASYEWSHYPAFLLAEATVFPKGDGFSGIDCTEHVITLKING